MIKAVVPESAAARNGELRKLNDCGLAVLSINEQSTNDIDKAKFASLIREGGNSLTLVLKAAELNQPSSPRPDAVTLAPTNSDGVQEALTQPNLSDSMDATEEPAEPDDSNTAAEVANSPDTVTEANGEPDFNSTTTGEESPPDPESSGSVVAMEETAEPDVSSSTLDGEDDIPEINVALTRENNEKVSEVRMSSTKGRLDRLQISILCHGQWGLKCKFHNDGSVIVNAIAPESAAARSPAIKAGMTIVSINHVAVQGAQQSAVADIIRNAGTSMNLVLKHPQACEREIDENDDMYEVPVVVHPSDQTTGTSDKTGDVPNPNNDGDDVYEVPAVAQHQENLDETDEATNNENNDDDVYEVPAVAPRDEKEGDEGNDDVYEVPVSGGQEEDGTKEEGTKEFGDLGFLLKEDFAENVQTFDVTLTKDPEEKVLSAHVLTNQS